jgi:sugar phosphate isomerase/epimerase
MLAMKLLLCKTLWGHTGSLEQAAQLAVDAGFGGIEAPVPIDAPGVEHFAQVLQTHGLVWIQEICTAGSYVPRRHATISEHLRDFESQLHRGLDISARFANIMGGCDAWEIDDSVRFFSEAQNIAERIGVTCSFETHRGRSFFTPWNTVKILDRLPGLKVTCDFSHWTVVCERLMDSEWEATVRVAQQAHHIHGRVGYDQGPQVPHPGAPEYAAALASHQRCWEAVWDSQNGRGYTQVTMTPEFGPDGYLHTLPFTGAPIADLWDLNCWIGATERRHFERFSTASPSASVA